MNYAAFRCTHVLQGKIAFDRQPYHVPLPHIQALPTGAGGSFPGNHDQNIILTAP
jgi:hypothetical protein